LAAARNTIWQERFGYYLSLSARRVSQRACVGGIDDIHRRWSSSNCQEIVAVSTSSELVFRAWNDLELFGRLDYKTLQMVQAEQPLDGNPLYAILHEPIYCQGYVRFYLVIDASLRNLGQART
jgi:hypothetical protein